MNGWGKCKNILCVRADNMGDVIMTAPALRALKETFDARITLLTSESGSLISAYLPEVDETLSFDLPWIKSDQPVSGEDLSVLAEKIRSYHFDAVIIFTVYSQSALPAALFSFLAGIPKRLAYNRENPYDLLTDWLPDHEPFDHIIHQVERDLNLVKHIGAIPTHDFLSLTVGRNSVDSVFYKLKPFEISEEKSWIVLHPGVSEEKRKYPERLWIEIGKQLLKKYHVPLLITGSEAEIEIAESIVAGIGTGAFNVAGKFTIEEFISLISKSRAVISVNTSTIHIAAAMQTPLVVLYAQTNPQHTPWKSVHVTLPFSVEDQLKSKNTIVRLVSEKLFSKVIPYPDPAEVLEAISQILDYNTDTLPTVRFE